MFKWLPVLVLLVLLLAVSILIGSTLVAARSAINRGVAAMRQADSRAAEISSARSPDRQFAETIHQVQLARADFRTSVRRLTPLAPILEKLSWVPVYGSDISQSRAIASLAVTATQATLEALDGMQGAVLEVERVGNRPSEVRSVLGKLDSSRSLFERSNRLIVEARTTARQLSRRASPQVRQDLEALDRRFPVLETLNQSLLTLPQVLGYRHNVSYLVVYQDAPNLQSAGAFNGSIGVLTLRDGASIHEFSPQHAERSRAATSSEVYRLPGEWSFSQAVWTPNPLAQVVITHFLHQLSGGTDPIEGVVDVTYPVEADILSITGPFYSSSYGTWITSHNVAAEIRQFTRKAGSGPGNRHITRETSIVQVVADHTLASVNRLSLAQMIRLGGLLGRDIGEHRLFLSFRAPAQESLAHALRAS